MNGVWVMTQNKQSVGFVSSFMADVRGKSWQVLCGAGILGSYKSETRAYEIIQDIWNTIKYYQAEYPGTTPYYEMPSE
jgi:hypothetical protein